MDTGRRFYSPGSSKKEVRIINPTDLNIPGLDQQARKDFDRAHFKAFINATFSRLRRTNNDLLPFDEIRRNIPWRGQADLGYVEVPLDHIIGSVGRYQDFDRAFLPKLTHIRSRWENIDRARMKDIPLPAVEMYKIGEVYFVKDGNHRVSVARERGQAFIDAFVIEIHTDVAITPETDLEQLILVQEYQRFLDTTGLERVSANREIHLTQAGQYEKLLEHIQVHRWYLGEHYRYDLGAEKAARSWYKRVYLPLVEIISNMKILAHFPGRSEADLYLWIIEHQYYLAEQSDGMVTLEQAAKHFVNRFSYKPLNKIRRWLARLRQVLFLDQERLPESWEDDGEDVPADVGNEHNG
jgi:hypothetical protein